MIVEFKKTLKSDWLFCFTVPFSLDEKKDAIKSRKWCDLGVDRTAESQSDCKDHQRFQYGSNKSLNYPESQILPFKISCAV